MEADQPEFVSARDFYQQFLERPWSGQTDSRHERNGEEIRSRMLSDFYNRVYSPGNILITAAGNLNHDVIVKPVRGEVRQPSRRERPCPWTRLPTTRAACSERKKSLEQVHIALGVPAYPLAHVLDFRFMY